MDRELLSPELIVPRLFLCIPAVSLFHGHTVTPSYCHTVPRSKRQPNVELFKDGWNMALLVLCPRRLTNPEAASFLLDAAEIKDQFSSMAGAENSLSARVDRVSDVRPWP